MKLSTAPAAAAAVAAAAVLTLAAACGSQPANGGTGASAARPSVSLTINVRPGPHAAMRHWTLTCGPAGGSLPGAVAACAALSRVKDPFAPVRRGVMCQMIYSGPQTASVTGIWHGRRVHAQFSRVDGCQTQRWSRIAAVFGPYATPSPGGG